MTLPIRKMVLGAALALGMGLTASGAQAGVAAPAVGLGAPDAPALTENVRWVCGIWRCGWRPNWRYWPVPPYARGWGPPADPACVWRRGPLPGGGWGWRQICP